MPAVLDFRSRSARRAKQGRHERRRLLLLVLLLGLCIILIDKFRDPAMWRWFDRLSAPQPGAAGDAGIDNRLAAIAEKQAPGTFLVPNDRPTGKRGQSPFAGTARGVLRANGDCPLFPLGVKPEELASIRDDTPSTRDEQPISLRLMDILRHTDAATLRKASLGPVTYAQLFRQPEQYRGQIVSVAGVVRRVNLIELPENEYGIRQYYQVWLWPTDNPSSPIVVYCLELPRSFPTGMETNEQVEVTGFFFKRWAYQAQDTLRTAPTILARSLQWDRRPMLATKPAETWALPLAIGVAALMAIFTAWLVYVRTRLTRSTPPVRLPDFDALDGSPQPEKSVDEHA